MNLANDKGKQGVELMYIHASDCGSFVLFLFFISNDTTPQAKQARLNTKLKTLATSYYNSNSRSQGKD
jgi:hypothetical protein